MLKWIQDEYKAQVIAVTLDIGQQKDDLESIKKKRLSLALLRLSPLTLNMSLPKNFLQKE